MGFKPRSRLKKYYHVKPAQFIYPDEMVGILYILFKTQLAEISFNSFWHINNIFWKNIILKELLFVDRL